MLFQGAAHVIGQRVSGKEADEYAFALSLARTHISEFIYIYMRKNKNIEKHVLVFPSIYIF